MKFSEALDEYLELRETYEKDYEGYVEGYTNKRYYNRLQRLREIMDNYFNHRHEGGRVYVVNKDGWHQVSAQIP